MAIRHVYLIDDGGERHHYSAESEDEVRQQHYGPCGMACDCDPAEYPCDVVQEPDEKLLKVREDGNDEVTVKTCREWADAGKGLVCSTVY